MAAAGARSVNVDHDTRLETLEIKCAHLEHNLQELSDVVYAQRKQLDKSLALNQQLVKQVDVLAERIETQDQEPPPHY